MIFHPLDDCMIKLIQDVLGDLTADERVEFIKQCMEGYCHFCGSEHLPCYCQDDS